MEDLASNSGAAREALATAHRLAGWRLPGGGGGSAARGWEPPLAPPLAPWAAAAGAAGGLVFRAPPVRWGLMRDQGAALCRPISVVA